VINQPPRPARSVLLGTVALLAYSVWHWSVGSFGASVSREGFEAGLQLVLAAIGFTAIGHSVLSLAVTGEACRLMPGVSRLVCSAVVGQLVCVVWVVLRSGVSGLAFYRLGRQLPITAAELSLLGFVLVAAALRGNRLHQTRSWGGVSVSDAGAFVVLLLCMLLPLSVRELPRTLALSSDPDQHAFWASQVLRVGGIPWDQGILGVGPFDYPAGFSVLNACWMVLSQLSAVEIVTVQPMVQFLWGLMLCVALTPLVLREVRLQNTNGAALVMSLVALLLFWFALPYGMQSDRYHLSGTARLSTSMLSSVVILTWVLAPAVAGVHVGRAGVVRAVMFATTALIAMCNPMSAVVPAFLSCTSLDLSRPRSFKAALGSHRAVMLAGLFGIALLLCDPYFFTRCAQVIAPLLEGGGSASTVVAPSGFSGLSFSMPAASVANSIGPLSIARLLVGGLYKTELLHWIPVLGVFLLWGIWFLQSRKSALRYGMVIVVSLVIRHLASGIRGSGDVTAPMYLIEPYIVQGVLEFGVMLGCLLISVGWWSVCGVRRVYTPFVSAGILSLLCLWPSQSIALRSEQFKLTPRVTDCGSFGCASAGDLAALSFLEHLGADVVRRYPALTFESAPKVLLLGHPAVHGVERWVFPYGASRIAPMWSPLPVAFFYGRGSPLWSYENYLSRVCHQFDLEWMRQNNIRYLFMPSSNPGCLRGRERVLGEFTVLFERDGARVMGLF
jgi:hypothetical protein